MSIGHKLGAEIGLEQVLDWIATIAFKIHQSIDLDEILNIIVTEVREILESDRVVIYRFLPDGDGVVAEESVSPEWTPIQGQMIYDPCFNAQWVEEYREGRIGILEDINVQPLENCYKELLIQLQVQAKLVIPIFVRSKKIKNISTSKPHLWGLLIVHQCSSPRQWQSIEIKLVKQVVLQLEIALQQAEMQQQWRQMNKHIESEKINLQKQKGVDEELRWKEALLRSMTDTSKLAFYVVDNRTDEILYFNHRFCEIWGIEDLELQMQRGELKNNDIIPDCLPLIADVPSFAESCKPLQSEENRIAIEDEIAFVDGRTIRRFSSQIRDPRGRYFGRLYVFEDISDRKQAEERWQFALEGNGDGVWDWNVQTVFYSRRWKEILGFAEDEIGHTFEEWYKRIHPEDIGQVCQEIEKHFRGETEQLIVEYRIQCKDGTYKWFLSRGKVLRRTEDGRPLRAIGTDTDITDRKLIEEALRDSEERYHSVIAVMAEGIVLQQADGKITAWNKSAEKILGLTTDRMMGRTSIDPQWRAIHEDGSPFPGETHPAMVTLRTGQPLFNQIMGVYKPDGSLIWISINSQPLFQASQSLPHAAVTSFTDITVYKQAEQALQQQAERERTIYTIAQNIRQSLDLDEILNTTVTEVRHFLQTDRALIYRFNPDWSGVVVKESVAANQLALLNMEITDTYFVEQQGLCQQNILQVTSDIYTAGLSPCHIELLEKWQVRAKLVVPILQAEKLWGLLVAHHCTAPREWHSWEIQLLQQLATQVAIAIQQSELHQKLQIANQQLENLAMVDQLTQIANRRSFDRSLIDEWHRLAQEQHPLSLLICDIDYFKQYNDTYGHAAGDTCLAMVAQAIKNAVWLCSNLVARYGGEEFVVILPNKDRDEAIQVAKEIHQAIQTLDLPHTTSAVSQYVTLSIGISTVIPTDDMNPLDAIEAADRALYQAKNDGRNRWVANIILLD